MRLFLVTILLAVIKDGLNDCIDQLQLLLDRAGQLADIISDILSVELGNQCIEFRHLFRRSRIMHDDLYTCPSSLLVMLHSMHGGLYSMWAGNVWLHQNGVIYPFVK